MAVEKAAAAWEAAATAAATAAEAWRGKRRTDRARNMTRALGGFVGEALKIVL